MQSVKILIDENLSWKLLASLKLFPGSTHVCLCGLENKNDREIWNYARTEQYAILTRDIDFYSLCTLLGCPPKIIHLRTPGFAQRTSFFREKLMKNESSIQTFLNSDDFCYLDIE